MDNSSNLPNEISFDLLSNMPTRNPLQDSINSMQAKQNRLLREVQQSQREKEAESLRRHNELIEALKTAGENGAKIIIGDNANGIQIQQNAVDSLQEMDNSQTFNYEKALDVLKEVQGYVNLPQFQDTFKESSENIKKIIEETIQAVETKQEPNLIKKSLNLLNDLAIGAGGSLIASGMLALLGAIPM